ncbi:molecular chaperone DnaJ [Lachnospiraceae bacterium C7]|nr:molecular chaperone DnaJ [Lachnospiraceae bacterium C7]
MADKRDYYEVLGVSKDASAADIKKAFRVQAKKYHPDMHPGDKECEEKFKEIQEAYAVLSDDDKRRQYDQFGHAAFDGSAGAGAGGFDFSGMDMGDIFGDIFGDFFGGGSRRANSNGPRQGANVRMTIRISFEEAVFGCVKGIDFTYKQECATCGGSGAKKGTQATTCSRCGGKGKVVYSQQSLFGMVQNVQTCPDCNGTGKVVKEKCPDCHGTGYVAKRVHKEVEIPAGIDNGQSVRVRGYGEPGTNGGPRGDLLVEVVVGRSNEFERQEMNIFSNVYISYAIAAIGGDIRIKTVDGDIIYTVSSGTQTGTRIRLKGKGVPSVRNKNIRGDHYVTLIVKTPTKLSKDAEAALREFDRLTGDSLNAESGSTDAPRDKKKGPFGGIFDKK